MADLRQFEDDVIRWLLLHYGLLDTRTRHMLLDIEEQLFAYHDAGKLAMGDRHPRPRMLTFRAFHGFFPDFPVQLNSAELTSYDCKRLAFPKPFVKFEKTRLCRDYQRMQGYYDHFALVYRWPYQKTMLAIHNCVPPDTGLPGVHCCWRLEDDLIAVMQELPSFVASVDRTSDDASWKSSALNPNYDEPVSAASSTV